LKACSPRKNLNLGPFQTFSASLVLSVRYSDYEEKRPVTPSELWNNKRIKEIQTKTTIIKVEGL